MRRASLFAKCEYVYFAKENLYTACMKRLVHLNALHALEAVLRRGTLKDAARELGISPAAAGQRIRALEEYLGHPLLERGPGGTTPGRQARLAMRDLRAGFDHLRQAAEALDLDHQARVSLRCDPDWLALWMAPRLPRFAAAAPQLRLELQPADEPAAKPADLRIFFGTDPAAELLRFEHLAPFVSPRNHTRLHRVAAGAMLDGFPLMHLDLPHAAVAECGWPDWVARFGHRRDDALRGPRYSSAVQAVRMAEKHVGALLCPLSLGRDRIDRGLLRLLFDGGHTLPAKNGWRVAVADRARDRRSVIGFLHWLRGEYYAEGSSAT